MKLGTQIVPSPVDATDVPNRSYVDTLGGRGNAAFILAEMSGNQADPIAGDPVAFDTALNSRDLTVNGSGRFSTLKAGRTYYLVGIPYISHTALAWLNFQWYDVTGASYIGTFATAQTTSETSHDSSQPQATAIFTPTVDSEVELRVFSVGIAGTDISNSATSAHIIELFGSPLHGGLEHLETVEVTGSAVQDVTFSGLDGNADEHYVLFAKWVNGATPGSVECEIRPNAISTGGETEGYTINSAVLTADRVARILLWGSTGSNYGVFTTYIHPQTGASRGFISVGFVSVTASTGAASKKHGHWNDTSTNITSLLLHADVANGFGVGTKFSLYRLRSQNGALPTLDKVNVYQAAQTVAKYSLGTASGAIAIDASLSNTFDLTVNGAATIGAPTNLEDGQTVVLRVRQDATGSRAVTFNAVWDFGDDGAPDTSADAGSSLMIVSGTSDGTNIFATAKKGFTNT